MYYKFKFYPTINVKSYLIIGINILNFILGSINLIKQLGCCICNIAISKNNYHFMFKNISIYKSSGIVKYISEMWEVKVRFN